MADIRLKVAITAPSLDAGRNVSGVSSVVRQLVRVLGERVAFRHIQVGAETPGGRLWRLVGSLSRTAAAVLTCATAPFDVLHANIALNPKSIVREFAFVGVAWLRRRPVLIHLHGGRYVHEAPTGVTHRAIAALLGMSRAIVVLGNREEELVTGRWPMVADRVQVIYNGTQIPVTARVRGEADGPLQVVFIGRLSAEKGIAAIAAMASKASDADNIALTVYGDGPMRPEVERWQQQFAWVRYAGAFLPEQLPAVLNAADVLILPSTSGEGMPMAVIEAMAHGVVPISTPISSVPEIVIDGQTGLLIAASCAAELFNGLRRLEKDRPLLARLSRGSRDFAAAQLDADANMVRFAGIYKQLTDGGRSA